MSQQKIKVAIVGATGATGKSIAEGLLAKPEQFEVTAFARSASLQKPELAELASKGASLKPIDLDGTTDEIAKTIEGMDVVISGLTLMQLSQELALVDASKKANVGRYVPSFFGPVCPPRGVMNAMSTKEDILDAAKKQYLPYTVIDVGWWYQMLVPSKAARGYVWDTPLFGDGEVPVALTDNRDIGPWVARIIADPRTLNKKVFLHNEIRTLNNVYATYEKVTGKTLEKPQVTAEDLEKTIAGALAEMEKGPEDKFKTMFTLGMAQYQRLLYVRGDNVPERAKYLGYLDAKELYPDMQVRTLEPYFQEVAQE